MTGQQQGFRLRCPSCGQVFGANTADSAKMCPFCHHRFPFTPPPPPSPPSSYRPPPPDPSPQQGTPVNIPRIAIVIVTIIGVFFALRAIQTHLPRTEESTTATSEAPTGSGAGDVDGASADTASTSESKSDIPSSSGESIAETTNSLQPDPERRDTFSKGNSRELERDLANIEKDTTAYLAMPDTTVYQQIAGNIRQSAEVQMAVLRNLGGAKDETYKYEDMNQLLKELKQYENDRYCSSLITGYSVLFARASVGIRTLILHEDDPSQLKNLNDQLAAIRRSVSEATCDAALVTAVTFLDIGREGSRVSGSRIDWDSLASKIRAAQESEQHIVRKTDLAHQVLCDVLTSCVKAWDRNGASASSLADIQRERASSLATAQDSFYRLAAYTKAETQLIAVLARSSLAR